MACNDKLFKKRIGNTIDVRLSVLTNGEPVSLVGRDISVILRDPRGLATSVDWHIDDESDHTIRFVFEGRTQRLTGTYWVEVWENKNGVSQAVFDKDVFTLLPSSSGEEDGVDDLSRVIVDVSCGGLMIGGISVVSIRQVVESTESGGENVWRAIRSDGRFFDLIVRNGARGDDGHTPYIRDGYWFINGENTGARATVGLEELQIDETTGKLFIET